MAVFLVVEKIGWKTGTSYGNRDAWAVGMTPDYAVGVWVGNCTGAVSYTHLDVYKRQVLSPSWDE